MTHIVHLPLHPCVTGIAADAAVAGSALIHAGHLDADACGEASLAIERGLLRVAPDAQLIIVGSGRPSPPRHGGGRNDLRTLSRARTGLLFASYLARQRLLVPGRNEVFGDIFLQALASGVPLDTINYYLPRPSDIREAMRAGSVLIRTRIHAGARPRPTHRDPRPPRSVRGA